MSVATVHEFSVSDITTRNVADVVVRKGDEVEQNEGLLHFGYLGSFSVEWHGVVNLTICSDQFLGLQTMTMVDAATVERVATASFRACVDNAPSVVDQQAISACRHTKVERREAYGVPNVLSVKGVVPSEVVINVVDAVTSAGETTAYM